MAARRVRGRARSCGCAGTGTAALSTGAVLWLHRPCKGGDPWPESMGCGGMPPMAAGTCFWGLLKPPEKSLPVTWWKMWSGVWIPFEEVGSRKAELNVIISVFDVTCDEKDSALLLPLPCPPAGSGSGSAAESR